MTMSKRLSLAISLAPLLGALAFAVPAQAAPPSGGQPHVQSGVHGDFHHGSHGHDHHSHDGFGFGFGFWDPGWGWGAADYWDYYPYPYAYPYYYYPPYPAYYAPAPGPQAESGQAAGAPPPQYWYYCDNPQGYYPYVQNCSTAWRQVAATQQSGSGDTVSPRKP